MGILKRVIGLSIAALLTICLVAGGVWAYFTDTESSAANAVTAGTLDMVPDTNATNYSGLEPGGNTVNGYATFSKMSPGQSGTITWTLYNQGSIPGTLTIDATVSFNEGTPVPYAEMANAISAISGNNGGGNGDLDTYVGVRLQRGIGTDLTDAEANFTYILGSAGYVPFSGLAAVLNAENQNVAASGGNDTLVYKLSWNLVKPLAGAGVDGIFGTGDDTPINPNIIQSDTAQIDLTFTLTQ